MPPPQEKHGGGSEFYRILHRKISELLFIETAKNYRKPFFRYFIGLIIRKFILRLNITSDKILSYNIAAAKSIFGKHSCGPPALSFAYIPHSYAIYPIMCGHMKKSLKLSKFLTPTSIRGQDTSSVFNFSLNDKRL